MAAGTEPSAAYPAGQPLQLCKATRVGCVGRTEGTGSTLAGLTLGTAETQATDDESVDKPEKILLIFSYTFVISVDRTGITFVGRDEPP